MVDDSDVTQVLKDDGVKTVVLDGFENQPLTELNKIKDDMGSPPWAVRLVYNDRFGGVMICQNPGEGNRLHYHPNADECWVILEGEWEWYIEGEGTKRVKEKDIVLVKSDTKHKIVCVGMKPAIRFAITAPDVKHTYAESDYKV